MKNIATIVILLASHSAFAKLRPWNEKMQEIGKTFSALLPEVVGSEPLSPESKKLLESGTKQLSELAHTIKPGKDSVLPPEADPTIRFVSGLFEREAKSAYQATLKGEYGYARTVVSRMAGYCIACHTRHNQGPDFPTIEMTPKVEALSPMARGELLTALRQFDQALAEYEKVAANGSIAEKRPWDWAKAVRYGVSLAVRVKEDPDKAASILNTALALPNFPQFFKQDAASWKQSIEQWKKDKAKTLKTEEALYREAVRLTDSAKAKQEYLKDHSQDIAYLRATALLHRQLAQFPTGKRSGEALLLAGNAYSVLESAVVYPLPEFYYEACVRQSPQTALAEKCFHRLEQEIYLGYSGSGGTFIPDDIKATMNELRGLSHPTKKL